MYTFVAMLLVRFAAADYFPLRILPRFSVGHGNCVRVFCEPRYCSNSPSVELVLCTQKVQKFFVTLPFFFILIDTTRQIKFPHSNLIRHSFALTNCTVELCSLLLEFSTVLVLVTNVHAFSRTHLSRTPARSKSILLCVLAICQNRQRNIQLSLLRLSIRTNLPKLISYRSFCHY